MPTTLQSIVAEFCRLYQLAREKRQGSLNALRLHAATLERYFRGIQEEAQRANNDASKLNFGKTESLLTVQEGVELRQFFLGVSRSVMEAQAELDRQSQSSPQTSEFALPQPRFCIPTARAELKVGLRELTSRGVNLVLFKGAEEEQKYAEGTISFELSAVPPDPAAISGFLPAVTGAVKLTLLDGIRERAAAGGLGELGAELGRKVYANTREQAVVLRFPPQAGTVRYLILWPGRNENEPETPDRWRTLLIFAVEVLSNGEVVPVSEIFEGPDAPPCLVIGSRQELERQTPQELALLVVRLGDAVVQSVGLIRQWLELSRRP